ncbi:MAG: phosphate signaling complex protein PhoU [Woeseia sp.]
MTRKEFHSQLRDLTARLDDMANLAKSMLRDGVLAFENLDRKLAEDVDSRKEKLADLDDEIEAAALNLLALQGPMASDLRRIGATLKLITYLNRLGRYGRDIGNALNRWPEGQPHAFEIVDIPNMGDKVLEMLDLALTAFREGKEPDVAAITRLEDQVDTMRRRIWDSSLVRMFESNRNIEPGALYMMVARYLERCGDNVCKMTEKLMYLATGQRITVK